MKKKKLMLGQISVSRTYISKSDCLDLRMLSNAIGGRFLQLPVALTQESNK